MLGTRQILGRVLRRGFLEANRVSGGALEGPLGNLVPRPTPTQPITVTIQGRSGEVPPGCTVLEACAILGVELEQCCGGDSTCGTCRVQVEEGALNVSRSKAKELGTLECVKESAKCRLGCQVRLFGPVTIVIPEDWRSV